MCPCLWPVKLVFLIREGPRGSWRELELLTLVLCPQMERRFTVVRRVRQRKGVCEPLLGLELPDSRSWVHCRKGEERASS